LVEDVLVTHYSNIIVLFSIEKEEDIFIDLNKLFILALEKRITI